MILAKEIRKKGKIKVKKPICFVFSENGICAEKKKKIKIRKSVSKVDLL